jgi:hypothetical protein
MFYSSRLSNPYPLFSTLQRPLWFVVRSTQALGRVLVVQVCQSSFASDTISQIWTYTCSVVYRDWFIPAAYQTSKPGTMAAGVLKTTCRGFTGSIGGWSEYLERFLLFVEKITEYEPRSSRWTSVGYPDPDWNPSLLTVSDDAVLQKGARPCLPQPVWRVFVV